MVTPMVADISFPPISVKIGVIIKKNRLLVLLDITLEPGPF